MPTKRMTGARIALAVLVSSVLLAALTMAQVTGARLEGVVKDQTQAVIPGVTVAATHEATNITYDTVTNMSGFYLFPRLPPGNYSISAELPSFKRNVKRGVPLQVGDTVTVDFVLETGEITDEVIVTGQAPTVDRVSQVIGTVVQEKQIAELPLMNRNPMMLFYMQAGVNPVEREGGQQQAGTVDGLRTIANNVTVEGVYAQDPFLDFSPANPSFAVPSEAVGEYRVVTSSASAEYGRGAGAQVQVVYRSGSNEFHGSAYEYVRNTVLNANNFFNNRQGTDRPTFKRNQFGFSLGGPIIRNRAFFFGTYEGVRQRRDSIANYLTYTQTARNGGFRYYMAGQNSTSLVDANGNPKIPGSQIGTINVFEADPTRLGKDPTGLVDAYLKQSPLPNNYDIGDGFNLGGYRFNSLLPYDEDQYVIKGDVHITPKHQLSLGHSRMWSESWSAQLISGWPIGSSLGRKSGDT
ncbi:MAG: carboxypeptidase regulatory-like domain-containing protein, partial [Acidobacteriota bacterium]